MLLAACGGDHPKVASAAYLQQCRQQLVDRDKLDPNVDLSAEQVADICRCTQDFLVKHGFGDKRTDDKALEGVGRPLGRSCAQQVLTGAK